MSKRFRLVLVLLCITASASVLSATTAVQLSDKALVEQSNQILIGRCTNLQSRWEGRVLVTDATVEVEEWFKGEGQASITVTLPGGTDANRKVPVGMTYAGAPTLQVGEEAFLFLVGDAVYGRVIAGFSQGKFSIIEDRGEKLVSRDLTTIRLTTGTGAVRGGTASRKPLTEFKKEIRELLSGSNR